MSLKYALAPGFRTKLLKNLTETKSSNKLNNKNVIFSSLDHLQRRNFTYIASNRFYYNNNNNKNNEHRYYVPSLFSLGGILSIFGLEKSDDKEDSNSFTKEILKTLGLQKEKEETDESKLIMAIKRGILLIQKKDFKRAEEMLHSALRLAQDMEDEDGITYIYDILANLAFSTEQYVKAEKLFVSVLQRLIAKGEEKDSNRVIDISLKLAKIFETKKEFNKAEQGYKFCIDTLDPKLKDEDEDTLALWGMSMDWYARFLLEVNRKTDALKCFQKAYEMCVKVNGLLHEQTVVLLNDLGTVCSLLGDNEGALSYLEKAKNIGKSLPDMKDLAAIYINLGQLYLMREMYRESKLACQEGMKMAKKREDESTVSEAKNCLDKINEVLNKTELYKKIKPTAQVLVS
ncbi:tetratricopeptide repeat protein, putative [Pediculus humanus corporis]|uniref:Tetratricopeptide repeat protein, putative n=1 Tax=Pediculus humanus subsp. corporis TaxID=121224 RepID=E0VVH8_PEDHC|nr:tetratricopeptide repeat protein, putative [Pediculus humanus corporis]EEB17384.1 tetratricopeptide repeat protein, putative [Pediculus humanus corporis]